MPRKSARIFSRSRSIYGIIIAAKSTRNFWRAGDIFKYGRKAMPYVEVKNMYKRGSLTTYPDMKYIKVR